jgi:isoquinoline 1-oxidoreductase beta subunit
MKFQPFCELMMGLEEPPYEGAIPKVPRRAFLRAGLAFGGGLLLGFSVSASGRGAPTTSNSTPAAFAPNAFIRIGHDGEVALIIPQVEMGQGTYTALSMLIAEELEVALDQVRIEAAPPDDPMRTRSLDPRSPAARPRFVQCGSHYVAPELPAASC